LNKVCLAGLLTYPGFLKPSHPDCGQWQVFQKTIIPFSTGSGITAAGTVTDLHRIPFSLHLVVTGATPQHYKYIVFSDRRIGVVQTDRNSY
jgi:hypothetical protein